jgi:hypothetical protein
MFLQKCSDSNEEMTMEKNNDPKQTIRNALARAIENATDTSVTAASQSIDSWSKEKKSTAQSFPFTRWTW